MEFTAEEFDILKIPPMCIAGRSPKIPAINKLVLVFPLRHYPPPGWLDGYSNIAPELAKSVMAQRVQTPLSYALLKA